MKHIAFYQYFGSRIMPVIGLNTATCSVRLIDVVV